MAKVINKLIDEDLNKEAKLFTKKLESDMHYKSEFQGDEMSFTWLNEIEFACPYIDNIIRRPRVALITESDVVQIGKAKKIGVESVKDLSKHTQFIEKIDDVTGDVQPSQILIVRNEETFNTYENRFLFTLLDHLNRFIVQKEDLLNGLETKNDKELEYSGTTITNSERINIELKISTKELPKGKDNDDFAKEIESVKARLKKVKQYMKGWNKSEIIRELTKAHVPLVHPPISKTNLLLKNPNFQIAMKLWAFLQAYDMMKNDNSKEDLDTEGDDTLKGILNDTFLNDYFVLKSISKLKREQKKSLSKYSVIMLKKQLQRTISILLQNGLDITESEILELVSGTIEDEKNKRIIGRDDVKKKFKSAMDEYLERAKEYL